MMATSVRPSARTARIAQGVTRPHTSRPSVCAYAGLSAEGKVVSAKMDKTATVEVQRYQIVDPRYGKRVMRTSRYHMHDENNDSDFGDVVWVKSLPQRLSKTKTMVLERIVRKVEKL